MPRSDPTRDAPDSSTFDFPPPSSVVAVRDWQWLSAWAGLVSFGTETPFWFILLGVFLLAMGGGAIALFWMARWAERDAPGGQFSIASLFLAMVYAAAFLASIRWALVASRNARLHRFPATQLGQSLEPTLFDFAMTSLFGLAMLYVSLPIILGLLDSVMWSAVWLIKRPGFKALAKWSTRRSTRKRSSPQ